MVDNLIFVSCSCSTNSDFAALFSRLLYFSLCMFVQDTFSLMLSESEQESHAISFSSHMNHTWARGGLTHPHIAARGVKCRKHVAVGCDG